MRGRTAFARSLIRVELDSGAVAGVPGTDQQQWHRFRTESSNHVLVQRSVNWGAICASIMAPLRP